jgi:hypothetical protein
MKDERISPMLVALIVLAFALSVSSAILTGLTTYLTRYAIPGRRHTVILNLLFDDQHVIRGVLFARQGDFLILKLATVVEPDGASTKLDGDFVIDRQHVGFYQIVPP